jgi:two-component system LytT family response regulator
MTRHPSLRVVVVDDEAPARALLREFLSAEPNLEIVAECENGFEAVRSIPELQPDVVFLDIQMPKLNGFEVLDLIEPGPLVIFCTAYDEYALKAFEVHAVDYLLKPFSRERLLESLRKATERLGTGPGGSISSVAGLARSALPPGRFPERILLKEGSRVHVVPVDRLAYLEAQDDYVAVHSEGKSWLKSKPLAEVSEGLDPARFVRIHRSYVLNLSRLARIELVARDSRVAILPDGRELPVSRAGYARLKALL